MNKERYLTYIAVGLFACLMVSLMVNCWQYREAKGRTDRTEIVIDTVYNERTDTAPKQRSETLTGVISVPVRKISDSGEKISENAGSVSDSTDNALEIAGDSVRIPITQKVYEDSLYTAYVSGYHQSLDSITIRERTVMKTVTNYTTETEFRRWNIGLTAGYGYGVRNRNLDFFIGVGLTYNLFPNKKRKRPSTAVAGGF